MVLAAVIPWNGGWPFDARVVGQHFPSTTRGVFPIGTVGHVTFESAQRTVLKGYRPLSNNFLRELP
jgi:hypothetical protein